MSGALDTPGVALDADRLIGVRRLALSTRRRGRLAKVPGGFASRLKGQGIEIAETRAYAPGDDIRHIDRGTSARTGRLHVRQFQQDRDRVVLLVADFRPAMLWGLRRVFRSVAAAEALALIGWSAVESGGRVGLLTVSTQAPVFLPPRGRARGMLAAIGGMVRAHRAALEALQAGAESDPPLDRALSGVDRMAPSGAEVVMASGFDNPLGHWEDRLDALSRRRFPRLLMITGAARLPAGRYPVHLGDGARLRLRLGSETMVAPSGHVGGREALVLDAGAPVESMADRLFAAAPGRHAA